MSLTLVFFLKSFLRIHMSFFGATCTPVLDFWWRLLWGSMPEWVLPYSHCGGKCNVHSPRSTSGATCANILAASLLPVLSPCTVAEVRLPGFELVLSEYLWVRRSTNWAKPWRAIDLGVHCIQFCLNFVKVKAIDESMYIGKNQCLRNKSSLNSILLELCKGQGHRWINVHWKKSMFEEQVITSFFGNTDAPVLDFWWHPIWVSKPEQVLIYSQFVAGSHDMRSLWFSYGVTPADLFEFY